MTDSDIVAALQPVIGVFERLGVTYQIGGSVASSAYGVARSSLDVDVVADLGPSHVDPLVDSLRDAYYADRHLIAEAVRRRGSFNLIHLSTMMKVDVFVLKDRPYDRESMRRRRLETLEEAAAAPSVYLTAPEDVVLHKLEWYRSGGEVSERQWLDVLGVLKVQRENLDREYLTRWASALGVDDLLGRAFEDAGPPFADTIS